MTRVVAVVLVGLLVLCGAAADDPKPRPEDVSRRFYRCWLEVEEVRDGQRTTDPERLAGVCFPEGKDWFSWGRRGEAAAGHGGRPVRLDPTADPIRVDVRTEVPRGGGRTEIMVHPCIVRFDGDRLVMAWPRAGVPERALRPGEDYPERPRDFTSTKENGVTVRVLKPCDEYDRD